MGTKADERWVSGSGEVSWQTVGKDESTSFFDKRFWLLTWMLLPCTSLVRSRGLRKPGSQGSVPPKRFLNKRPNWVSL